MPIVRLPELACLSLDRRALLLPRDLPAGGAVLIFGFTHGARFDVGVWKQAMMERGLPWYSLPTATHDGDADGEDPAAAAMRSHAPRDQWPRILLVHRGGETLRRQFHWEADGHAKVLKVDGAGQVLVRHDWGPFTPAALEALLA